MKSIQLFTIFVLSLIFTQNIYAATDVEFVLDVSGSMVKEIGGQQQIDIARTALINSLAKIPAGENVSLRVYGHRVEQSKKAESCKDTELLIPFGTADVGKISLAVASLKPKGYTPIAYALEKAGEDFKGISVAREAQRVIILLSDGEETCGGDSIAVLKSLRDQGITVIVHTIGFNVGDVAQKQLEEIAQFSGGKYFNASNAEDLGTALDTATTDSYKSLDKKKSAYEGKEVRGGDSYQTATPLVLGDNLRLDHHQKANDWDYFYLDLNGGENLSIKLKTLEKGIFFDKSKGVFGETGGYHAIAYIKIHDSNNKEISNLLANGKFQSEEEQKYFASKGRYYILIGPGGGYAMNKDHVTFSFALSKLGDLDSENDAGDSIETALPIEIKEYKMNYCGDADQIDYFSIQAKKGQKFTFAVVPVNEQNTSFSISIINEFKINQRLTSQGGYSGQGLVAKSTEITEDGKYYVKLKCHGSSYGNNQSDVASYSLTVKAE